MIWYLSMLAEVHIVCRADFVSSKFDCVLMQKDGLSSATRW